MAPRARKSASALVVGARGHGRVVQHRLDLGGEHESPADVARSRAASRRTGRRRASATARVSSQIANANIPLKRSSAPSPHSAQACRSTSVSPSVRNAWPAPAQLVAQLAVVVDLAVEDEVQRAEVHRLVGALVQVDDRQPPEREAGVRVGPGALAVRPAVRHRRRHPLEKRRVGRRAAGDARDPAHYGGTALRLFCHCVHSASGTTVSLLHGFPQFVRVMLRIMRADGEGPRRGGDGTS